MKNSKRARKINGVVLWRGKSLLDGSRIVVIVTGFVNRSANEKTGEMLQCWILPDGTDPLEATKSGADRAVCGDCPFRPANGGGCYVRVERAPLAVWRAYKAGAYERFNERKHLHLFRGESIRLGAYGDPAAAPLDVYLPVLVTVNEHTGYSHQWKDCDQDWRRFVMASVQSEEGRLQAAAAGWRTFRIRGATAPLMPGEFVCPASEEAGYKTTCKRCRACDGQTSSGRGASPVIVVHGYGRYTLEMI